MHPEETGPGGTHAYGLSLWSSLKSSVDSKKLLSFLSGGCELARAVLQLQPQVLKFHECMQNINQVNTMHYVLDARNAWINKTNIWDLNSSEGGTETK